MLMKKLIDSMNSLCAIAPGICGAATPIDLGQAEKCDLIHEL